MELFRFALVRPPLEPALNWSLDSGSTLQKALLTAFVARGRFDKEKQAVVNEAGSTIVEAPDIQTGLFPALRSFYQAILIKKADPQIDGKWFVDTASELLGDNINALVDSPEFVTARNSVYDTLVMFKVFRHAAEREFMDDLLRIAKSFHFIDLAVKHEHPGLAARSFVEDILALRPSLPPTFDLTDANADRAPAKQDAPAPKDQSPSIKVVEPDIQEALMHIERARPQDFVIDPEVEPPAADGSKLVYLSLRQAFVDSDAALSALVAERNIDITKIRAPDLHSLLLKEGSRRSSRSRGSAVGEQGAFNLIKIGSQLVPAMELNFYRESSSPLEETYGAVRPVGIADLLVVRQHIARYEHGEIAHVENVLESELRWREHERSERTESETMIETETSESQERDLQTTERFELKDEAEQTIKQDASLEAGVSLSGSYGPITLSSSLTSSSSTAVENAKKQATTFAKDVVSRAASRTASRTLVRRTEKKIFQLLEKNRHEFDNRANGKKNITGIYQWLNKVYTAQTYNYGKRMLYEIVVPEPAALWKHSKTRSRTEGETLFKPPPFNTAPTELDEVNYLEYVGLYNLSTSTPPPELFVTVAKAFAKSGMAVNAPQGEASVADLPKGYRAFSAKIRVTGSHFVGAPSIPTVDVTVGTFMARSQTVARYHYSDLDNEIGQIPVLYSVLNYSSVAISVEVTCRRTSIYFATWQADIHSQLQTAYRQRLSEYQRELERREGLEASGIEGSNPLANEQTIRAELKRNALVLIRRDNFTGAGSLALDAAHGPYPDVDRVDAASPIILFFEQAFEWEQLTYRFYDYYWGAKDGWHQSMLLDDQDDNFRQFLRSGAARLILPVRPEFEEAVAHYFETGVVWTGDEPPPIHSKTYLPIIGEIKGSQKAPGTEEPYGDPWDVVVPTSLVVLKSNANLPVYPAVQ